MSGRKTRTAKRSARGLFRTTEAAGFCGFYNPGYASDGIITARDRNRGKSGSPVSDCCAGVAVRSAGVAGSTAAATSRTHVPPDA
jgi:hypothetical protein